MFKFVKRSHYQKGGHSGQIVITYSVSEIVIGFLLIGLVGFYVYQYLKANLYPPKPAYYNMTKVDLDDSSQAISPSTPVKTQKK